VSTNLDLVRLIYADFERGEFSHVAWAHPEIEWIIADGPTAGRWTGVAGMEESARTMLTAWEDPHLSADEYRELDKGRVLVLYRWTGHGKTSGLDLGKLHARGAAVYHVHGGRVTKIVHYWDRDRALADLGLDE
jgi:ketosteroid isomerase-like protein